MNFALLDNGIVTNIIWINPEQQSEFQPGAPTGDLPVMTGDTYENGKFYRNGEEVTPFTPTPEPEPPEPTEQRYTLDEAAASIASEVASNE